MNLSKIALSAIVALSIGTAAYGETVTCNGLDVDLEIQTFDSLTKEIEECRKDKSVTHYDYVTLYDKLGDLKTPVAKTPVAKTQVAKTVNKGVYYDEDTITFAEIEDEMRQKTEVQEKYYSRGMENTAIKWEGAVMNVTTSFLGKYTVSLDVDGDDFYDVDFDVSERQAVTLNKGSYVTVKATVKKIWKTPFGGSIVTLKNAKITK